MSATVLSAPRPQARLGGRFKERLEARRAHATLLTAIGTALAGAGADPSLTVARRCPVCGGEERVPAFTAPVFAFDRCRGCGLVYTPRLLRDEVVRARYSDGPLARAYWRHMRDDAAAYSDGEEYAPLLDRLLDLVPSRAAAIDVGCHFGRLVAALRPRFDDALGLELDPRTAAAGSRRFGVRIATTRLQELDRPPGSVDLIVFNQVLEHIAELETLVASAVRLLRPGGVVYVGVPHGDSVGLRLLGGRHPSVATHMHVNLFTAPALRALAQAHDLLVRELSTDDSVDVSATDWFLGHAPDGAVAALALDKLAAAVARRWRLPSRFGRGAQLELIASKRC
jgi:SAM-dependent methyltransferase